MSPPVSVHVVASLSSQAYNNAQTAEECASRGQYKEAINYHSNAKKLFRKVLKQYPNQRDETTIQTLTLVIEYHKARSKELVRYVEQQQKEKNQEASNSKTVANAGTEKIINKRVENADESNTNTPVSFEKSGDEELSNEIQKVVESNEMKHIVKEFNSLLSLEENIPVSRRPATDIPVLASLQSIQTTHQGNRNLGESFLIVPRDNKTAKLGQMKKRAIIQQPTKTTPGSTAQKQIIKDKVPRLKTKPQFVEYIRSQKSEINRLVQAVRTLSKENENLLKEREALAKAIYDRKEDYDSVVTLKNEYNKRFASLKDAMGHFFDAHGHQEVVGELVKKDVTALESAKNEVAKLKRQLENEQAMRKKAESKVKKFQKARAEFAQKASKFARA